MGLDFWITSFVVTATPGSGALFTIAAGLSRGVRMGQLAAVGCALGALPHLVLALSGTAAVLAASPVAFEVMKWLGVGYLLYMAWGTWHQRGVLAPGLEDGERSSSAGRTIGGAVLVNLLNPKLTLFFFVFLPMFVDPASPGATVRMAMLGAAFMVVTLVVFGIYGACAAWLRSYVVGKPGVMGRIGQVFGLSFVALAMLLAFTPR
ncbi:lysine transporter LysE [Prauserella marina]|uniref:Threonine/homoserine/homoserine lactone efflux protein n=1 Tax=Prauserella marina TaxID=530584 RepID=A0A222VQJ6_9PSEU|nr:LysE family translocator [Prauserella marina]ASR36003.1 lysine transporter LysE [Prauserella marina]PWV84051.1 threonine/homoserine/homoserine lactone efflux protein [Prauserella marina]SDC31639.1 Threonine/homoserine/homoserine lactone efflux protein [Prauserella marina]